MAINPTSTGDALLIPDTYLDVERVADGRYCVQFIKERGTPRKSYTAHVGDVVKQAQRAGNIPIRTEDEELRRLCRDCMVKLI
jgi:hypothetical protein